MINMEMLPRRDFQRNAVMLAGTGVTAPLWAAMKYKRDAAMRYFREQASETDARVKAGIEANRKGDATLVFTDAQGPVRTRPRESAPAAPRLTNLVYGIDEGRILSGLARGSKSGDLAMRIVGDTYQAAYDARIVRQLFDSNADYFAAWGYFSGPHTWFDGLPSVSFHVARESAKFKGMRRLPLAAEGKAGGGVEADAVEWRRTRWPRFRRTAGRFASWRIRS